MGKKDKGEKEGSKGSKKGKKSGSNVFDMFSQKQVAEFKDGFAIIDRDKDGILNKADLRAMFDEIGRIMSDEELEAMLAEPEAPVNFTTFITMFAKESSGEVDEDEVIVNAVRAFEKTEGEIDADAFRTALMAFGEKFTSKEVDDVFACVELDEDTNMIDADTVIALIASPGEEKAA